MLRTCTAVSLALLSLNPCAAQNAPAKSEKEKLVDVCQAAWRLTAAVPKSLKAEGTFSTFVDGKEDARATVAFTAKGERYRADVAFEAGKFPQPGTKMVVLRDPGTVFSARITQDVTPFGLVTSVGADVWDEHTPLLPPHMTFLPTGPFRTVHAIDLDKMKVAQFVVAKSLGNGDIELHYDFKMASAHGRIVCAKDQGYNVTLCETYRDKVGGPLVQKETATWKAVGGAWCPEEATWAFTRYDGKTPLQTTERRIKYTNFDTKAVVGAGVLSLDDVGLSDNARIQDRRKKAVVRERFYQPGDGSEKPLVDVIESFPTGR